MRHMESLLLFQWRRRKFCTTIIEKLHVFEVVGRFTLAQLVHAIPTGTDLRSMA